MFFQILYHYIIIWEKGRRKWERIKWRTFFISLVSREKADQQTISFLDVTPPDKNIWFWTKVKRKQAKNTNVTVLLLPPKQRGYAVSNPSHTELNEWAFVIYTLKCSPRMRTEPKVSVNWSRWKTLFLVQEYVWKCLTCFTRFVGDQVSVGHELKALMTRCFVNK